MKNTEEKRYKELFEHLNDAVYTVHVKTLMFTSVNPAAEHLTGYKKHELLHMNVVQILTPESLPIVKRMINRKLKKDQATIYEVEIIRKDGKKIPVEISSRVIYENNARVEILGVARDVSERKMIEHSRNVFITLISHEIKNPLTSSLIFLDLLQKRLKRDTTALSYLKTTVEQVNSINRLLSDFLDITQMRIGKFEIIRESFNFDEMMRETIERFHTVRKITVNGKVGKHVTADRNRIVQVITNLLSNALKYSLEGRPVVVTLSQDKDTVKVGIQDFGEGIKKTDQKHIFDLFYRSKNANQATIKGHGIGLYICREIIKRHKGKIWVDSILGKGSIFYFTLPIKN